MPRPYDHTAFANKLKLLAEFQRECGHTNVPWNHPDKSLFNWVTAQKRAHAAGTLAHERKAMLAELGFVFPVTRDERPGNAVSPAANVPLEAALNTSETLEDSLEALFLANFEQLSQWLDEKENATGQRNLAYRDTQTSDLAKTAYGFVEQMALQAQQGHLTNTHRTRLMMLAFTVNGRSIDAFLPTGAVLPASEGVPFSSSGRQSNDAAPGTTTTSAEGQRSGGQESPYLTTEELARRLNYDPRTIREVLKDRILVEERHYFRPFGRRKILWIWDAIHADIRNGLCKLSTSGADPAASQDALCTTAET